MADHLGVERTSMVIRDLTERIAAQAALRERGSSLLAAGVSEVAGIFLEGDAVEIHASDGSLVGKGLARCSAEELESGAGNLVVVHRDDLVLLG